MRFRIAKRTYHLKRARAATTQLGTRLFVISTAVEIIHNRNDIIIAHIYNMIKKYFKFPHFCKELRIYAKFQTEAA